MNSYSTDDDRNEAFLAPFVTDARGDVAADDTTAAADRVRASLPARKGRVASRTPILRYAAVALVLSLALFTGQQMLPGNAGQAFAEVQQWFENFRSVHIRTTILSGEQTIVDVDVQARADGAVRIEQAGIVTLLDPAGSALYTLMPGNQYFAQPLADDAAAPQSLEWFEDIREFRGEATRLGDTRTIDGQRAEGFRLQIDATDLTLWAAEDTHRPLLLTGTLPGGLTMTSTLRFDVDLPDKLFELPPGYRPLGNDE